MCDYSLESVRSRPARIGDKLVTRDFGTGTRGFSASDDPALAVCVLPGTELAFVSDVACPSASLFGRMEDQDNQPPDSHLSAGQQGQVGCTSRCARISGWAHRAFGAPMRGSSGTCVWTRRRKPTNAAEVREQ